MNRGIFVALSPPPHHQLPAIATYGEGRRRRTNWMPRSTALADEDRIDRVLRKSRTTGNVRSLDPDRPDLLARATRLSNLYGTSLDSGLARKGAGGRPCRRRRQKLSSSDSNKHGGSGSPSVSREQKRTHVPNDMALTRKKKRVLRSALDKAGEAALRYTREVSAGMRAFDGPPLGPKDVKDALLRIFRIRISTPEAAALITHFTKSDNSHARRIEDLRIEHGTLLHAIQRLRRKLLTRHPFPAMGDGESVALRLMNDSRSGSSARSEHHHIRIGARSSRGKLKPTVKVPPFGGTPAQQSTNVANVVRALAKVDRAASAYDPRRVDSLRKADLSRGTSPRAFGGVLLARFDVRVDPAEQKELVALLEDENGTVDVERFRVYFLSLIHEREGELQNSPKRNGPGGTTEGNEGDGRGSLPTLFDSNITHNHRQQRQEGMSAEAGSMVKSKAAGRNTCSEPILGR